MALLLNVPYSEKDEAKALGARWNPTLKRWYVEDRRQYKNFQKWLNGNLVVCNQIYIVEGVQQCYRCGQSTTVIGFGMDAFFDLSDTGCDTSVGDIHICEISTNIPSALLAQLEDRYNFKRGFSRTLGASCLANHCRSCKALQGNFYLYEEVDSPFFIDGKDCASALTIHKICLPDDIVVGGNVGFGSGDYLIRKYAKIVESDLRWE